MTYYNSPLINLQLYYEDYECVRDFIYFIVEGHEELYTEQSICAYVHRGLHNYSKLLNNERTLVSETVLNVSNDTLHECALQIVTQWFICTPQYYVCQYNDLVLTVPHTCVKQFTFEYDSRYNNVVNEQVTALCFLYSLGIQK